MMFGMSLLYAVLAGGRAQKLWYTSAASAFGRKHILPGTGIERP
jgi:hypothetical protein